ncbi:MAG TPA: hypothetical protein VI792_01820 [Candidatus Eisenbacteria bacterium]
MRRRLGIALVTAWAAVLLVAGSATPSAAAAFSRLRILLPGEAAAPGTPAGKTGAPQAQTAGVPFTVTVQSCDDQWNTVTGVSDVIQTLCSDASATLPGPSQIQSGSVTLTVTLNAGGTFTIYAHDQTDTTIPDGTSSPVTSLVIQGFVFSRISQKNQYAGVPFNMTITAVDASGNTVSGYSGTVRIKETTSYGDGFTSPATVTLGGGTWSGPIAAYRADETSINRGNVNFYAWLDNAPAKNGTSDPFTVHPGPAARVQIVLPGQTALPGSPSGLLGSPASQTAGQPFTAGVYETDNWWNPVAGFDNVRLTSSDPSATLASGSVNNGYVALTATLRTVGTQTITVTDQSNGSLQSMTSAPISVLPAGAAKFVIAAIASPQTAGTPAVVSIRATDASGNTIPNYSGQALLIANTGAGSISPELVTFVNGLWSGAVTFMGAGGAVSLTCSDFSSPPHTGTSNNFVVLPGPLAGLQVLLPGESARGGTATGKTGTPTGQSAGNPFTLTVRAVDAWWNLVPGVSDSIALGSTDAFARIPAETTLVNGQVLIPTMLYRSGNQVIWASDVTNSSVAPDTSAAVTVTGGSFSRLLVLAPGESPAPGTATGRTGTATDESINYAFTCTVLATDAWWNPVTGVSDVAHLTSTDPMATLPPDQALVDGRADMNLKLATGGFQQITVSDASRSTIQGSSTQVKAISTGFHLEAAVSPASALAGQPFTLTVKVVNDAGSVIQEINSFVTVSVQNASTRANGRGTLLTTQFQLLQGQRSVNETYTFAEPIVLVVQDNAGNGPGITGPITILPGAPTAIQLTSAPPWVGGNKHATVNARVVDAYANGVSDQAVQFALVFGTGTLVAVDSLTDSTGVARADFLSPRIAETDHIRAVSGPISADLNLQVALVDPNAAGGTVTNFPNPFHPPTEPTTIAYKLDDDASVRLRVFTMSGDLVRDESFARGATGGRAGLNQWPWDGRNARGSIIASGGYLILIEAHGSGETQHVMRRKIAVVR